MSESARSPLLSNQLRTFQRLWGQLQPHLATDRDLPRRIQQLVTSERRFGSRDRKLYRELLYTALRFFPWYEELAVRSETVAAEAMVWLAAPIPAMQPLKESVAQWGLASTDSIADKARILGVERSLFPAWIAEQCPAALSSPLLEILHQRSPLWLRLQTDRADDVFEEFTERGWAWRISALLPTAVEIPGDPDITQSDAFITGKIEIQDLGSQLVLESVGVPSGGSWLDACAGAGGKTLQLASLVGPKGKVRAHDIRADALAELQIRVRRAKLDNVRVEGNSSGLYDGILIDAPCTGSGTWRRSPHLKWCTTASDITAAAAIQLELLNKYSLFVKPGGKLIYATCSLAREENSGVVNSFLKTHPEFAVVPPVKNFVSEPCEFGLTISPATQNSDGFFVSSLVRK